MIVRTPTGRKITEVARVLGASSTGYQLDDIDPAIDGDPPQLHRRLVAV
ncbi:MAG TPA: hypothetical protein VGF86_12995 [Candidatus Tumulicola sp.]